MGQNYFPLALSVFSLSSSWLVANLMRFSTLRPERGGARYLWKWPTSFLLWGKTFFRFYPRVVLCSAYLRIEIVIKGWDCGIMKRETERSIVSHTTRNVSGGITLISMMQTYKKRQQCLFRDDTAMFFGVFFEMNDIWYGNIFFTSTRAWVSTKDSFHWWKTVE